MLALALLMPAAAIAPVTERLTIRETVIVRVSARAPTPQRIRWKEKKAPRCMAMDRLAGAVVAERDSVDLLLRDGQRLRAKFAESCPALSYYSGFYIVPTTDRRICADRDAIHDRSGGECPIERFRRLVADPAPSESRGRAERIRR